MIQKFTWMLYASFIYKHYIAICMNAHGLQNSKSSKPVLSAIKYCSRESQYVLFA